MAFGFGKWQPSYNTLDVPLNIGWQCTLAPRFQCGTELWFLREDARKAIEEDRIAFDRYFRPNLDLRTITGGEALRIIQRFLRTFLRVAHWNQPTSNEAIERFLRKAVHDEALVPVVNRGWRLAPRFDVPPDVPQRWPKQVAFAYAPRDPEHVPMRQRGGGSAGVEGLGGAVEKFGAAGAVVDNLGGVSGSGSAGGFDWLGAAESVAGAVLGGYGAHTDDDRPLAMSLRDDGTPLDDASSFEYSEELTLGDGIDIAARGVSEPDEGDCFALYERNLDECRLYAAMTGEGYTYVVCKAKAFLDYNRCRGY